MGWRSYRALQLGLLLAAAPVVLAAPQPIYRGGITDTELRKTPLPVSVTEFLASVSVDNFPATQTVSGSVTIGNWPGSQAVTIASLPLPAGASTEATLALIKAKTDNLDVALSTRTKPADTQAISAAALPLPSGAATSAKQDTLLTELQSKADLSETQPVSLASVPSHAVTNAGTFPVQVTSAPTTAVTGAFYQATQPISAASLPLPAGAATEAGNLATIAAKDFATQTTLALIKAKTDNLDVALSTRTKPADAQAVTGSFWQSTQPVSIASMPSTPVTGTFWQVTQPVSGTLSISNFPGTQAVSGTFWQVTQPVSGTFWQATQPVSGTVAATQSGTWTVQPGNTANTTPWIVELSQTGTKNDVDVTSITPPTLTKGTQGATGFSVQALKDAGRTQVMLAWEEMAGTAGAESALTNFTFGTKGAATQSAATSYTVTSGKTLHIQSVTIYVKTTGTVNNLCKFRIRQAASSIANNSPVIWDKVLALSQNGTYLAGEVQTLVCPIPDGLEVGSTQQITFTWFSAANTCTVGMGIDAYEY